MAATTTFQLACELAKANTVQALAQTVLQAACECSGVKQGLCYWHEEETQQLLPIASEGGPDIETLPAVSLDELDNPLVRCLTGGMLYQLDRPEMLADVGTGFDTLRDHLTDRCALLVVPIHGKQHRIVGVFMLVGGTVALEAWQHEPASHELMKLHQILLARLDTPFGKGLAGQCRRGANQQRQVEPGRARASRLLRTGFIGTGQQARGLRDDMLRLADSSLSLLVTGETGSGKDHVALLIHQASSRAGRFVPVNCAAIPKDLIEAELFGAARGAYTGAVQSRTGLVAEADGGTLFLDEIGDMPLSLQGTLLRVLNEKKFRPVGATREQGSDFRLICATHRPLPELVRNGSFREDLYFRIRQQVLRVPPLRERFEDIPALVAHTLAQYNRDHQGNVSGISATALARLQTYSFPGNIRELRSLVLAAAERTAPYKQIRGDLLRDLGDELFVDAQVAPVIPAGTLDLLFQTNNLREAMTNIERLLVGERLRQVDGSRRQAALSLGIPKRTLARKCQEWKLDGKGAKP